MVTCLLSYMTHFIDHTGAWLLSKLTPASVVPVSVVHSFFSNILMPIAQPIQNNACRPTEQHVLCVCPLLLSSTVFPVDRLGSFPSGLEPGTVVDNVRAWCKARSSGVWVLAVQHAHVCAAIVPPSG